MKIYERIAGKSFTKEDLFIVGKQHGASIGMDSITRVYWDGYNKYVMIEGTLKGKPHKYWTPPRELRKYTIPSRQWEKIQYKNRYGEYYDNELREFASYIANSVMRGKLVKYNISEKEDSIVIYYKCGREIFPSWIKYSMYELEKFLVKQHGGIVT